MSFVSDKFNESFNLNESPDKKELICIKGFTGDCFNYDFDEFNGFIEGKPLEILYRHDSKNDIDICYTCIYLINNNIDTNITHQTLLDNIRSKYNFENEAPFSIYKNESDQDFPSLNDNGDTRYILIEYARKIFPPNLNLNNELYSAIDSLEDIFKKTSNKDILYRIYEIIEDIKSLISK